MSRISNIYHALRKIEEGNSLSKNNISAQENMILSALAKDGKISLENGFYSKITKNENLKN